MSSDLTPMMRQYLEIKQQNKDAILFFRLGDFYEMFFDDAVEATRILHITLTSRGKVKGSKVPMCGVPYHAANNYIARLVRQGKKVAICEQVEEPSPGKKIVKREISRIITPGTVIADELLDESINNYILSLNPDGGNFGLAYADISTGEFRVTEIGDKENLFSELYKISPSECLVPESFSKGEDFEQFKDVNLGAMTVNEDWAFDHELSLQEIKRHFMVESLEGFGCQGLDLAVGAAGALLRYLKDTQKSRLTNIGAISTYRASQYMIMDKNTYRHLELTMNCEDLSLRGTLVEVLDKTRTPMGKRRLRKWILNPLIDTEQIKYRTEAVQYFYENSDRRKQVREILADIYDIERLSNKVSLNTANARDMVALASSLRHIEELRGSLKGRAPKAVKDIAGGLDDFKDVIGWIDGCLVENPPNTIREGGLVKKGYETALDELKYLVTDGKDWVAALQKKEIERTGISTLKVGYNKVFGYYIEVTRAKLDTIPPDYVRKQTLVNAERFVTQELKDQESRIIGAEERSRNLEYEIFCSLRAKVAGQIDRLKGASDHVADLDVLSDLAEIAVNNRYCRPRVNEERGFRIIESRHPVLEKMLKDKEFVPNDIIMDDADKRIFIITGSNMAGKSTYIRQAALITIMAQMGSFVPAKEAEVGVVDRIFTRVGASDRLYQGMSTFMVEMLETANILNNATGRSLIILDEIGRGTSTYDGVSIAWAVVEFIHHKLDGARALFATHYHELIELSSIMKGIKNYHLAVQEWGDEVIFLYKVTEGSCDDSFGIHVAKLAGMPGRVVERARDILNNLQKDSFLGNIRSRFLEDKEQNEKQFDFFEGISREHPAIDMIRKIDTDNMTPLEALKKMEELKGKVSGDVPK
ncbi:MAG: DNA mismatch repair protein MutS [Candidatus Omnitrophota bacterium]|nr:DNA mismatch repair protein MutS [Candidatus Omnitrophota bacterium]